MVGPIKPGLRDRRPKSLRILGFGPPDMRWLCDLQGQCPDWNGWPVVSVSCCPSVKATKARRILQGSLEVCVCVCTCELKLVRSWVAFK